MDFNRLLITENMNEIYKLLLAGAVLLGACDPLEQIPVSIISENNFYRTGADAEAAIIGVYDGLQNYASNNMVLPPTIMGDEADAVRGGNFTRTETFAVTPTDGHIRNTWEDIYQAIGRANDVLEKVPTITDSNFSEASRNRILGEARFIRGFMYLHLVRRFGKVPVVTEAFSSPDQDYQPPRDEVDVVFNQVITDLQEAKNLLPATVSPNKTRASKWAAAGILAKAYLDRNAEGDKEKALAEINEIIASNAYSLVSAADYDQLFLTGAQNTSESIFEVGFGPAGLEGSAYDHEYVPGQNFRVEPSQKIVNAFKADSALIVQNGKTEVRMAAALEWHPTRARRYYIDKYSKAHYTVTAGRIQASTNVIVLRLADILLLKAELENEANRTPQAIDLLNQIRNRVNLPNTKASTQAEVRLAIEDERFKELAFEGHRYYDLLRTGRAMEVINNKGTRLTDLARAIWPIPQFDIDQNPSLLPQNPGY